MGGRSWREGGHLAILKWLRANGCAWYARATARCASRRGHAVVRRARRTRPQRLCESVPLRIAVESVKLD
jgi:hypothetical protein